MVGNYACRLFIPDLFNSDCTGVKSGEIKFCDSNSEFVGRRGGKELFVKARSLEEPNIIGIELSLVPRKISES